MGLLEGLFKDKDNSTNKEIESLNVKIKEMEIQRLKIEVQTMKETYMTPKQVEILEKNLKSAREENVKLKKEKEDFIQKIKILEQDSSDKEEVFFLNKFLYKLPIDEFFSATKFNLIREFLTKSGISFVQEIETVMELPEFMKVKNYLSETNQIAQCQSNFKIRKKNIVKKVKLWSICIWKMNF